MLLGFVFLINLINAADCNKKSIVGFSITPEHYVDSVKWLDQVKCNPNSFPTFKVDFSECAVLSKILLRGIYDKSTWPTKFEPDYITKLKETALYGDQVESSNLYLKKNNSSVYNNYHVQFVCFLVAAQLSKLINRMQFEQAHYFEGFQGDTMFKVIKNNDFNRMTSDEFYKKMYHSSLKIFTLNRSQALLEAIKKCDDFLSDTPSSLEYNQKIIDSVRNYFLFLNSFLVNSHSEKAKL